jgi:alkylation response protein AidB-like acyl-CoA dehydrogenase
MQLVDTVEQRELRAAVRRFLTDRTPPRTTGALAGSGPGFDRVTWKRLATELGLPAIGIPERLGGAGYGAVEQTIVLEELGRALYPGPYLASAVLAAGTLLLAGDGTAARRYLPAIASGERIGTLALPQPRTAEGETPPVATRTDQGWLVSGRHGFVLDGRNADLVLVAARTSAGSSLFAVEATAAGLTARALPAVDQTRQVAELELREVPAVEVGAPGAADRILSAVLDRAGIALAAEALGGADAALEMMVGYAKTRRQFGRPIGSFQAVKHRCADVYTEIGSSRAAVRYGAWAVASSSEEVPLLAPLIKAYATDTFYHAASANIQIHGGIGFTWEHDAHLYFKRATFNRLFLGDPAHHRQQLAARIGL